MRACLSFLVFLTALSILIASPLSEGQVGIVQKHPFTFEDMMALKRVEEPEVSPDGKWVLFAAVDVDLKANTKTPHVWVVPLNQTQGPSTQKNDSQTSHSSSLGIADFDSATGMVTGKHRLTNIATEASGELWSPDGKNILFESDVYPECEGTAQAEAECNAKKVEEAKESKVKALIFTHLLYRHWNAYKEGKRTHLFVIPANVISNTYEGAPPLSPPLGQGGGVDFRSVARDLTPGDYDAPVFSLGGQDDYAFSPDGQELCYASNHDAMPAASTNNDLFTVPVNFPASVTSKDVLAATKDITAENKAADNTPLYSPDGKYIAYRAQQRPGYESDRWRLMLYDRKTGETTSLTENFDRWVGSFAWVGSSILYFTAEESGASPVFYVMLNYQPRPVQKSSVEGYNGDIASSPGSKLLVFTRMSVRAPTEIYAAPWALVNLPRCSNGGDLCTSGPDFRLTHLNDSVLSQVSMSPLETFWFAGSKNDKVQGWIIKPPNFDPNKKYPVKFIVHGGPEVPFGDEWSYRWNFELFAANGYVVVFINFHGSPGYGQKFIDAINGDWGGAPFEDLMKGLDYAEQHYPFIDKDRECALGASYGGYMANWILGHTNRFKCIVSHDGMFNTESAWGTTEELWFNEWEFKGTPYTNRELYRKWSPHLSATNFKTPTLVIHGQLDYRLDVSQGFDLFTTLQRQGVPSKMLYFPDEGHWVLKPQNSQLWYKTVNDWVDQWVGKSK